MHNGPQLQQSQPQQLSFSFKYTKSRIVPQMSAQKELAWRDIDLNAEMYSSRDIDEFHEIYPLYASNSALLCPRALIKDEEEFVSHLIDLLADPNKDLWIYREPDRDNTIPFYGITEKDRLTLRLLVSVYRLDLDLRAVFKSTFHDFIELGEALKCDTLHCAVNDSIPNDLIDYIGTLYTRLEQNKYSPDPNTIEFQLKI